MAKIKYSAMVSDMRGKLNGSVMSKNRFGSYVRNKVTPVNGQTTAQVEVRNRLSSLSSQWRTLTQLQRDAWLSAVEDWQRTNIFGDSVKPTGANLFIRVNSNLLNVRASVVLVPPVKTGSGVLDWSEAVPTIADEELILNFSPGIVPTGFKMVVDATAPLSAGVNFVKNQFRQIAVVDAATASGINIYTFYVAKFGTPAVGFKSAVRVRLVNVATGEVSLPVQSLFLWA